MERSEFYGSVKEGIQKYLPIGYRGYQVHIDETENYGGKKAVFSMRKEGNGEMPFLDVEEYLARAQKGEEMQGVLIDLAVDYAKAVSKCRIGHGHAKVRQQAR